jgi:hypothetical protein
MKVTGKISEIGFHAFEDKPRTHQGHTIPLNWFVVADHKKARIFRKILDILEKITDAKCLTR